MVVNLLQSQFVLLLAIALLVISGMATVIFKDRKIQFYLSTVLLAIIVLSSAYLFMMGTNAIVQNTAKIYPFSMFFTALLAVGLIMINILSYRYAKDYNIFSMLFGFAAAGMFIVAMANSLITILLGLELMTLPTAFMIMVNGKPYVESAIKLFVLSAISIGMLAFAIVLIFPYDVQLNLGITSLSSNAVGSYFALLSVILFIASLSFDASLFPFNFWVPDVYQGAPANITAMLAGVNKKVAFIAILEIFFLLLYPFMHVFSFAFEIIAIFTMFFGNIVALVQTNVKRLFAYSAISQAGYITIGLAVATQYGVEASIFQIVAHLFMIIGAFAVVLWLENRNLKSIQDYAGLSSRNPIAAAALTIFMLSMIGVPFLAGFVGKLLLFTSAISGGYLILAAVGIINSFISVYYYSKVIISMYARKDAHLLAMGWPVKTVIAIALIATILFGIYPQPLITAVSTVSRSLFGI